MNQKDKIKAIALKIYKKNDPALPISKRYRRRPVIEFKFETPGGRRYSKSKTIPHIDLYQDLKKGIALAQEYEKSIRRKLALDTLDLKALFQGNTKALTLGEFQNGYFQDVQTAVTLGTKSAETLRAYGARGKTYSRSTLNIDLRTIGAAFAKALKNELITSNPFDSVKQLPVPKIPRHITEEEEAKLTSYFTALDIPYQLDIFRFGVLTGLRCDEIFSASFSLVELHTIEGRPVPFLRVYGKGSKLKTRFRFVPALDVQDILDRRRNLLQDQTALKIYLDSLKGIDIYKASQRAKNGFIFFELSQGLSISQFIRRARIACDLGPHIKPHALRHTFAIRFLEERKGDIYRLSQILGHSSVKTTEIYLYATPRLIAG